MIELNYVPLLKSRQYYTCITIIKVPEERCGILCKIRRIPEGTLTSVTWVSF